MTKRSWAQRRRRPPPAMPAADPVLRAESWALSEQVPTGLASSLVVAAVVAWALTPAVPARLAVLWLLGLVVTNGVRALEIRRCGVDGDAIIPAPVVRRHLAWTGAAGLLWAATPWLLWPEPDLERLFVITLAILGLTAGSAVAYAPARAHFELFAAPPVASLGLRLVLDGQPHLLAAAAFCPVYLLAMVGLARKRREDAVALAATDVLLTSLHHAAAHPSQEAQESLRQLLAAGCRYFGLDLGIVSRVKGGRYRIVAIHSESGEPPFAAGEVLELSDTVCAYTMTVRRPVAYARAEPGGPRHPAYRDFSPAYVGQVIVVDGAPYGTVNFSDPRHSRFRFNRHREDLIGLMAEWLGSELSRRELEGRMAEQGRRLQLFTDSIPALVSYLTPEHRYAYVNNQYERFFGRSRDSIVGSSLRAMGGDETYERLRPYLERVMRGEEQRFEFTPDLPDGRTPTFRVHYVPDWSEEGRVRGCFALLTEVTGYKETESRLMEQARRDFLTGLYNRRGFLAAAADVLRDDRKRPAHDFLCYLDLDRFKEINDRAGHEAGDEALRQVGVTMEEQLRSTDVLARIGGDEFGLLLTGCSEAEAVELLERLRRAVASSPFRWKGESFEMAVSVGAVAIDRGRHQVEDLLREADAACYAAKRKGRAVVAGPLYSAPGP